MAENAEDLKIKIECFYKVCQGKRLRGNILKIKVIVWVHEDGTVYDVEM